MNLISGNTTSIKSDSIKVPKIRLYLMKALYLLTFIGVGYQAWAEVINPDEPLKTIDGIVYSFWVAYATLMGLGLLYPLKMLPLLLLQLFYKSVWVLGVYLPLKKADQLDTMAEGFLKICIIAILLDIIVIPWSYLIRNYLRGFFRRAKT